MEIMLLLCSIHKHVCGAITVMEHRESLRSRRAPPMKPRTTRLLYMVTDITKEDPAWTDFSQSASGGGVT